MVQRECDISYKHYSRPKEPISSEEIQKTPKGYCLIRSTPYVHFSYHLSFNNACSVRLPAGSVVRRRGILQVVRRLSHGRRYVCGQALRCLILALGDLDHLVLLDDSVVLGTPGRDRLEDLLRCLSCEAPMLRIT